MIRILRGGNIADEKIIFKDDDIFIASEYVKSELYLKRNYLITPSVSSLEHIGKIALIDKDYSNVVVGGFVLMLSPHYNNRILSEYFLYALASKYHRDNCRAITHKSGQAFYNISRDKMMNLFIPLPPLAEQERIVTKLEELLPLVERYGDKQNSLDKLKNDFPVLLKKSILQEAVQGRLVPQDPSDEPASVLLERIRAEKQRLIKEGKIKKDKNESIIYRRDNSHYEKLNGIERCIDDEIPFEIPENWEWCRLGSISDIARGGSPRPIKQFLTHSPEGINWIKIGDTDKTSKYINSTHEKITAAGVSKSRMVYAGDFLLTNSMSFGRPYILNIDGCIHDGWLVISDYEMIYDRNFLYYMLSSRFAYYQFCNVVSGAVVKNLNIEKVSLSLFPIPPLAEQKRIVARIEELQYIIKGL